MGDNTIAIISEGHEIAYSMNLSHLFEYADDSCCIFSNVGERYKTEMYTHAAFNHANVSKSIIKIYIGNTIESIHSMEMVFSKYGMTIWNKGHEYVLDVNDKEINNSDSYDQFIIYANCRRTEYFAFESSYCEKIAKKSTNWISAPIKKVIPGLFRKVTKQKRQQQFECLAFVLYLDYIRAM